MADTSLSPQYFHLTKRSAKRKTGRIPVSTSSASTCPESCPLKEVCYAKHGPLSLHWSLVSSGKRGLPLDRFLEEVRALPAGQLWRHNEAGDLPGPGDTIHTDQLEALVVANRGKQGFTYTHKPVDNPENREAVRQANRQGFTVNLSADSIPEADHLVSLDIGPVGSGTWYGHQDRVRRSPGGTRGVEPDALRSHPAPRTMPTMIW